MEYQTNAPKGRDLLNERNPGWFRDIDLITFDIRWPWDCVLGQAYPSYREGLEELFGTDFPNRSAWEHGFIGGDFAEDDLLNSEWTEIIRELQLNDIPGESEDEREEG